MAKLKLITIFLTISFLFIYFLFSFAQAQQLPICVAPTRYLIWPYNFTPGNIPVASTTRGILTQSPIYVSNNNVGIGTNNPQAKLEVNGAIRLTPQTSIPTPVIGGMYFSQNDNTFYCGINTPQGIKWQPCGGGGTPPQTELIVPVKVWDTSKTRLVLEINEE